MQTHHCFCQEIITIQFLRLMLGLQRSSLFCLVPSGLVELFVSHSGSIDMLTELSSFSFLALFADVLFFLILQIVYISVAWSEALLFVSCIFLAAVDRDNPEDC
jgi:hypothetical protein